MRCVGPPSTGSAQKIEVPTRKQNAPTIAPTRADRGK